MAGFLLPMLAASGVSAIGSLIAGNESADAVSDASAASTAESRRQYNLNRKDMAPWQQTGVNALAQQSALLGLPAVSSSAATGVINGNDYGSYVQNYPDLSAAYTGLSGRDRQAIINAGYDINGDGSLDRAEFGNYHYQTNGAGEGRRLPQANALATSGGGAATSAAGGTADPYQAFLDSGFSKSMLETTNADFQNMVGAYGAAGNALSGSAIGALNDRNRRNTSTAFNNYYNALGGLSGTGANLTQASGQQGMQMVGQIGANNMNAANATASAYGNTANALSGALQNGMNTYAYGKGQGWF